MNTFVWTLILIYGLAWFFYIGRYICGSRGGGFAFTLWFPLTAMALSGAYGWLLGVYEFIIFPPGSDAATGLAAAAVIGGLIGLFPCVVVSALSLWLRPAKGSYSLARVLPVLLLFFGLILSYRPISASIENQPLKLTVLDTNLAPIAHTRVSYYTQTSGPFHRPFQAFAMKGEAETGSDGSVLLPVPRTHDLIASITKPGYANMQVALHAVFVSYTWRQARVLWEIPGSDSSRSSSSHGGEVETDSAPFFFTVYLPQKATESIPPYSPKRAPPWTPTPQGKLIDNLAPPSVWPAEPSVIRRW